MCNATPTFNRGHDPRGEWHIHSYDRKSRQVCSLEDPNGSGMLLAQFEWVSWHLKPDLFAMVLIMSIPKIPASHSLKPVFLLSRASS